MKMLCLCVVTVWPTVAVPPGGQCRRSMGGDPSP